MANEQQPRGTAAKTTVTKKPSGAVPTPTTPVSTAEPTKSTARNAVIQGNATPNADEIRRRAYELYEQRGRTGGRPEDDWHKAETELRKKGNGRKYA